MRLEGSEKLSLDIRKYGREDAFGRGTEAVA